MRIQNSGAVPILVSIVLVFGLILNAEGQSRYDSLITRATDLAYNVRFNEAESLFTEATRISPNRGEGYFGIAQIHLWIYLGTKDKSQYDAFMKWFDLTVSKEKMALRVNRDDYGATDLLGETYLLRSLACITARSYLDAFWAVKSAHNYFKKTLRIDPHFYDAYRGIGEIHYFLDFIPGSVRWTIGIFGLEGNKEKGFAEIRMAYEKGGGDRTRSALALAQIYSNYVAEYDSAIILMRRLVKMYPRNPMFNYHLAVELIKQRRLGESEKFLDLILREDNPDFTLLNNLSLFLKGDINFKLNNFQNAIKYNRMFLDRTKDPDYTGIASYRMAISYRALGNDTMMVKSLKRAMEGNQDIYDDSRARERSMLFLRKGISADELMTLEAKNDVDAGEYERAYSLLMPGVNKFKDRDARAEALLVLSEAAIHLGKFAEGIRLAGMAGKTNNGDEGWIAPRSWYFAALGNYREGDITAARSLLEKVKDTSEYRSNNLMNAATNKLSENLKER